MQESVSASAPTADSRPKLAAKGALQLAPRGHAARESVSRPAAQTPWESLTTMGASLAVVLGLFFSLAFVTRRGLRGKIAQLPGEVIEVLGKVPHVKGQELQLVRIGGKLLLLCVTPHGSEALTEFTDPTEVERLSAVCRRHHPQGVSKAFEEVLSAMGREKAQGFVSEPRTAMSSRSGVRHA
jgi:flagellar biogenesis protein FliO